MYLRSLEQPLVVVPEKEHDIYFFTGDRGEGKSTAAAALALYLRCYGGYQVYSTNSFLFGERVAPITSLAFSQSLPLKSIQFTDEAHTIADAQRGRRLPQSRGLRLRGADAQGQDLLVAGQRPRAAGQLSVAR